MSRRIELFYMHYIIARYSIKQYNAKLAQSKFITHTHDILWVGTFDNGGRDSGSPSIGTLISVSRPSVNRQTTSIGRPFTVTFFSSRSLIIDNDSTTAARCSSLKAGVLAVAINDRNNQKGVALAWFQDIRKAYTWQRTTSKSFANIYTQSSYWQAIVLVLI